MAEVGSAGGSFTTGAAPAAGGGGGVVGIGPAAAAGGGGGGGGGAAAGVGGAAGGLAAGAPPAPSFSLTSLVPGDTVAPSSTSSSRITPAAGDGTGTLVLSVSISQITSSSATVSPTCFSHLTSPSEMESAKAGQTTSLTSSHKTGVVLSPLEKDSQANCACLTGVAMPVLPTSFPQMFTRLERLRTSRPFLAVTCRRRLLDNWFLPDPSMAAIRWTEPECCASQDTPLLCPEKGCPSVHQTHTGAGVLTRCANDFRQVDDPCGV